MRKVIISIMVFVLIITLTSFVNATSNPILDELLQQGGADIKEDKNPQEIETGKEDKEDKEQLNTDKDTNKGEEKKEEENLPEKHKEAGLENYSSLILISVFSVFAIYAYKKIKEYNI